MTSNDNCNLRKAIFLDRDGVINFNRDDYVKSWAEFEFIPGVFDAIKQINASGRLAIIITNQSPIGRGMFPPETLEGIHFKMLEEMGKHNCRIDAIYYCPHHPDDGCNCRKPKPGNILRAAKDFNIDLSNSWMIGDSKSDLEAGRIAGCQVERVTTERPLLDIIKQILE
jgi:D-glycero-D-manno-heptose 1,7-bisphosphate phosphatase